MHAPQLIRLAVLCAAACQPRPGPAENAARAATSRDGEVALRARVRLPLSTRGLSGLARDGDGRLWSTPERGQQLVPLSRSGTTFTRAGEPVPLVGVPDGWDTESLAWIGPGTFAIGTETQRARNVDHVIIVRLAGGSARVVDTIPMPYAPWGIEARVNRGIEGLCHVDGILVAGNENVIEASGGRWAPLARYQLANRHWEPFRLRLVSKVGKIAAIACRPGAGDRIDLLAIERHYGSSRLVRFSIPRAGPGGDVAARQIADLGKLATDVPNLEGLDWDGNEVVAFVDNDTGGVTGPSEAIVLTLEP